MSSVPWPYGYPLGSGAQGQAAGLTSSMAMSHQQSQIAAVVAAAAQSGVLGAIPPTAHSGASNSISASSNNSSWSNALAQPSTFPVNGSRLSGLSVNGNSVAAALELTNHGLPHYHQNGGNQAAGLKTSSHHHDREIHSSTTEKRSLHTSGVIGKHLRRRRARGIPVRPKCGECSKEFSNQSALSKHKLTHSDERRFVCDQCSKAFKRQDHLKGHMLTHRQEKPFKCEIEGCEKSYCDARSLRRHRENHHSGKESVLLTQDTLLMRKQSEDLSVSSSSQPSLNSGRHLNSTLVESNQLNHTNRNIGGNGTHQVPHAKASHSLLSALLNNNSNNTMVDNYVNNSTAAHQDQNQKNVLNCPPPPPPPMYNLSTGLYGSQIQNNDQINSYFKKDHQNNCRFNFDPTAIPSTSSSNGPHPQMILSPVTPMIDVVGSGDSVKKGNGAAMFGSNGTLGTDVGGGRNSSDFQFPRPRTQSASSCVQNNGLQNGDPHTPITPNTPSTPSHFQYPDNRGMHNGLGNGHHSPYNNGYEMGPSIHHQHHNSHSVPNTPTTNVCIAFEGLHCTGNENQAQSSYVNQQNGAHSSGHYISEPNTPVEQIQQQHFTYPLNQSDVINQVAHCGDSVPSTPNTANSTSAVVGTPHFQYPACSNKSGTVTNTATSHGFSNSPSAYLNSYASSNCYPHSAHSSLDPHTPHTPHTPYTPCTGGGSGSAADPTHTPHFTFDHQNGGNYEFEYDNSYVYSSSSHHTQGHADHGNAAAEDDDDQVVELILGLNDDLRPATVTNSSMNISLPTSKHDNNAASVHVTSSSSVVATSDNSVLASAAENSMASLNPQSNSVKQNDKKSDNAVSRIGAKSIDRGNVTSVIQVAPSKIQASASVILSGTARDFVAPSHPVPSKQMSNSMLMTGPGGVRKLKNKHKPEPLVIPPHASHFIHAYQSHLRSPQPRATFRNAMVDQFYPMGLAKQNGNGMVAAAAARVRNASSSPPPYTPPPMLSPMRNAAGLYWTAHSTQQFRQHGQNNNHQSMSDAAPPTAYEPVQHFFDSGTKFVTTVEPHVNLGAKFQARIPVYNADREKLSKDVRVRETLMWDPKIIESVDETSAEDFIHLLSRTAVSSAGAALDGFHATSCIEKALHVLQSSNGLIPVAIELLMNPTPTLPEDHPLLGYTYAESSLWTKEEILAFQSALARHDKDFFTVAKEIKTKSTKECIEFYYFWKKANAADYRKVRTGRYRREQEVTIFHNSQGRTGCDSSSGTTTAGSSSSNGSTESHPLATNDPNNNSRINGHVLNKMMTEADLSLNSYSQAHFHNTSSQYHAHSHSHSQSPLIST